MIKTALAKVVGIKQSQRLLQHLVHGLIQVAHSTAAFNFTAIQIALPTFCMYSVRSKIFQLPEDQIPL